MLANAAARLLHAHAAGNLAEARELQEERIDPWCADRCTLRSAASQAFESAQRCCFCVLPRRQRK